MNELLFDKNIIIKRRIDYISRKKKNLYGCNTKEEKENELQTTTYALYKIDSIISYLFTSRSVKKVKVQNALGDNQVACAICITINFALG